MSNIETKTFKALYPDYATFKASVIDIVLRLGNTFKGGLPAYLDDSKTFYNLETLYIIFMNKYGDFAAVNEDDRQNALMVNGLLQTLPALYLKTNMLNKEALDLITPEGLLANIEKRYNEDAANKYASTETVYSSTPDSIQKPRTFDMNNVKEKNIINRKDETVRIKETSNLISKLKELSESKVSGFIYEMINSIEFSSLWSYCDGEGHVVVKGANGKDGQDGAPGKDGVDGAPGKDGQDGAPGKDGQDGAPGKDGVDGAPGKDGVDGAPGKDGVDGAPGKDGVDGAPASWVTITDLWTNPLAFEKYKNKKIRVTTELSSIYKDMIFINESAGFAINKNNIDPEEYLHVMINEGSIGFYLDKSVSCFLNSLPNDQGFLIVYDNISKQRTQEAKITKIEVA